jgi:hypothetical protein
MRLPLVRMYRLVNGLCPVLSNMFGLTGECNPTLSGVGDEEGCGLLADGQALIAVSYLGIRRDLAIVSR